MEWTKQVEVRKVEQIRNDNGNFVVFFVEPLNQNCIPSKFIGFKTDKLEEKKKLVALMEKYKINDLNELKGKIMDVTTDDYGQLTFCS